MISQGYYFSPIYNPANTGSDPKMIISSSGQVRVNKMTPDVIVGDDNKNKIRV
jgi:hypothetical protein